MSRYSHSCRHPWKPEVNVRMSPQFSIASPLLFFFFFFFESRYVTSSGLFYQNDRLVIPMIHLHYLLLLLGLHAHATTPSFSTSFWWHFPPVFFSNYWHEQSDVIYHKSHTYISLLMYLIGWRSKLIPQPETNKCEYVPGMQHACECTHTSQPPQVCAQLRASSPTECHTKRKVTFFFRMWTDTSVF